MEKALFFEKVYRIINKFNAKTKRPRKYLRGKITLYSSEVHMLEIIGANAGITTTQIADEMAITKGAVSQTTSKLLKKGLIQKQLVPDTPNTAMIFLTDKGQAVFNEHRSLHQQMILEIENILCGSSQETQQILSEILNVIDRNLDRY